MNKNIILYPELLSSVIKNKEEDIFTIWLFSKKIDLNKNGLIDLNEILNIAKLTLGLSSNYVYSKITKGIGLYWRKPYGKNGSKKIGLYSINKIIDRLKPDITRVKPFCLDQNIFKSDGLNLKFLRQLYISLVIGRFSDSRPISIQTLVENLGISESSIHKTIKSMGILKVMNNFQVVYETDHLIDARKYVMNLDSNIFKILPKNSKYYVVKQIPNSYLINDFYRLPLKSRPRSLKQNDRLMLEKLIEKRYHIKGFDKSVNGSKIISTLSYTSE